MARARTSCTTAGPGMGRSVASRFGREGFQVALVARNQTRLDAYTSELAANGIKAAGFAGDLTDRDALLGMIETITARFGPDPLPGCDTENGLASPETPRGAPGSELDWRRSAAAISGQKWT